MSKPDELLVDVAALVQSARSNQMSLTVVTGGAVITGRLAPEAVWRKLFRPLSDGDGNRLHAVWAQPAYRLGPHCWSGVG
ncbi:hypothetical protein D9753_06395 [Streptomyces dangxiongensis]|uniref:Uncharacterized protein n=1 Tax=Streptomyces dangxiongensis TaxID=1442032 RepID=A0A3G2JG50_9ACTN|nr:hypothetical protein [Streptomyces dangxiongensis]AYN38607.1 hypothetical protein D9753_06395 [Streptomyces dangxiongensis]